MSDLLKAIVELKVRLIHDEYPGWEARPVVVSFDVESVKTERGDTKLMACGSNPPASLSEAAREIVKGLYGDDVVEYRWNFQGSPQGHYTSC